MSGQLSRRERKKQETRQRLMESALQLFSEQGYAATTIKSITELAGVAKGTFFNYFETKEAILPAIAAQHLKALEDRLNPENGAPESAVQRIKLALQLMSGNPLCEPDLARQLFAAITRYRDIHPGYALRDILAEQVRQAQLADEMRDDLDAEFLSNVIRALFFQRVMMWHYGHSSHSLSLAEMLDMSVDLLMEGAAGPAWKRSS